DSWPGNGCRGARDRVPGGIGHGAPCCRRELRRCARDRPRRADRPCRRRAESDTTDRHVDESAVRPRSRCWDGPGRTRMDHRTLALGYRGEPARHATDGGRHAGLIPVSPHRSGRSAMPNDELDTTVRIVTVLVISGTGSGVGKTVVSAALAALTLRRGARVAV